MKKIYLAAAVLGFAVSTNAQTTLLSEDFQGSLSYIQIGYPSNTTSDTLWYNYNDDFNTDASGGTRPEEWFLMYAFATADSLTPTLDTNVVMGANSWISGDDFISKDHLITASIAVPTAASGGTSTVLRFKSASRQTPLYLDGFRVFVSNTTNDLLAFTATTPIFIGSEYDDEGGTYPSYGGNWASYTFTPSIASGGWVQGWDGTTQQNSELEDNGDSSRWIGVLTEQVISLGSYAGQTIFIDFFHNTRDDNLISIDDIVVEYTTSVSEVNNSISVISAYPNPTTDKVNLQFSNEGSSIAIMTVTDVFGRVVATQSLGALNNGKNLISFDASDLANGTYNVQIRTEKGYSAASFIKQ